MPMKALVSLLAAPPGSPVRAVLAQPLITVALLLFLYAGWHVRDEGSIHAGLRVAFIDTRAYRTDHEHEREAAMLQVEMHYAADTDRLVDELLTALLTYAPLAARVRLGVVHNGITGVTGVALLRYDVTNAVAAPGHSIGTLLLNQPLSDWNNFLPVLLAGRCYLGQVADQPNPALACPVRRIWCRHLHGLPGHRQSGPDAWSHVRHLGCQGSAAYRRPAHRRNETRTHRWGTDCGRAGSARPQFAVRRRLGGTVTSGVPWQRRRGDGCGARPHLSACRP